jgi:hypothetical protein
MVNRACKPVVLHHSYRARKLLLETACSGAQVGATLEQGVLAGRRFPSGLHSRPSTPVAREEVGRGVTLTSPGLYGPPLTPVEGEAGEEVVLEQVTVLVAGGHPCCIPTPGLWGTQGLVVALGCNPSLQEESSARDRGLQ